MSDDAHDIGAEQSLLGSVLVAPDLAGGVLLTVPPEAWWSPKHATLAAVLTDRLRAGDRAERDLGHSGRGRAPPCPSVVVAIRHRFS